MEIPPFFIALFFIFLVLGELSLFVFAWRINKTLRNLFGNQDGKDVFEALVRQDQKNIDLAKALQKLTKEYMLTADIASQSIQKIGVVRFNPFHSTGGEQSFCLALLDSHNNGVVITSLHANDMTRVYAKPVQGGASEHQLSREEEKSIVAAMRKNKI